MQGWGWGRGGRVVRCAEQGSRQRRKALGALTGSLHFIFWAVGVLEDFRGGEVGAGQSDEPFRSKCLREPGRNQGDQPGRPCHTP